MLNPTVTGPQSFSRKSSMTTIFPLGAVFDRPRRDTRGNRREFYKARSLLIIFFTERPWPNYHIDLRCARSKQQERGSSHRSGGRGRFGAHLCGTALERLELRTKSILAERRETWRGLVDRKGDPVPRKTSRHFALLVVRFALLVVAAWH